MNTISLISSLVLASGVIESCAGDPPTSADHQAVCVMGTVCCPGSPILIDTAGDGVHLSAAEDGVRFQLHPGRVGLWAWTLPDTDDGFLTIDLNGNGIVDDGSEMFGDSSLQVTSDDPNGFAALAYYDLPAHGGNDDGWIDARDEVWSKLRLWRDANHDAVSQPTELATLDQIGIHALSLAAKRLSVFDRYGNESRFSAPILADSPVSQMSIDIWLTQAPIVSPETTTCNTLWTCTAWAYAVASAIDPNTGVNPPCSIANAVNPSTESGAIVTVNGQPTRLVGGLSVGSDQSGTRAAAGQNLINAMHGSDGYCLFASYPSPDPNAPKSGTTTVINDNMPPWGLFSYHVGCGSITTCTNDGGGGCGGG